MYKGNGVVYHWGRNRGFGCACAIMKLTHKQIVAYQQGFFQRTRRNGIGLDKIGMHNRCRNDRKNQRTYQGVFIVFTLRIISQFIHFCIIDIRRIQAKGQGSQPFIIA